MIMGYTHYWTHKKQLTLAEWTELLTGVHHIFEHCHENQIGLSGDYDKPTPPKATTDIIDFNGIGDEAHETFQINRKRVGYGSGALKYWTFCKTARKPYDLAVTAILIFLDTRTPASFVVSSDGDPEDWQAGLTLARQAWPHLSNVLDIPRDVRDQARYARHLDTSPLYLLAVGHDGLMYLERNSDRARIQVPFDGDQYTAWGRARPHAERRSGSFVGNEHEQCANRRLRGLWRQFGHLAASAVTFAPLPA